MLELTRKQYDAFQVIQRPEVSFVLYGGAIRGAKTIWLAIIFAYLAIYYPNSRWIISRSDRPKIKNNLLPSINFIYSKPDIARHIVAINKTDLIYTFSNGSTVQLFAESYTTDKDLSRFHGLEYNGIGFDELPEFQQQTLEKGFERAGSWLNALPGPNGKKPKPLVLGSANPTKNWVKQLIYDRFVNNTLPEGWAYIQAKVSDNPYVPESYKRNLKQNMTPLNYQRFVDGDWEYVESNGHEWIYNFSYTQHVKKVEYLKNKPTYLTFDFNVWPYMTMLCFQIVEIPDGYQIRFYDEFCLAHPKNTSEDVCNAWIEKYPKKYGHVPVSYCGDASGESKIPGFGDKKAFNAVRTTLAPYLHGNSDRVYKKQFFNEFLRKFLNDLFNGSLRGGAVVEIIIDEVNCPTFIKDIQECIEDPGGGFVKVKVQDPKTGVKYEKNGHCVDAGKYGLLSVFSELYEGRYHRNNSY